MVKTDSASSAQDITLTLGGLETTLHFNSEFPLREMATFETLLSPEWSKYVEDKISQFADVAIKYRKPIVIDTLTWRASKNWFEKLGTTLADQERTQKLAYESAMRTARYIEEKSGGELQPVIQGIIGPMSDGYKHDKSISLEKAMEYHRPQVESLIKNGVKLITAATMTGSTEAEAIAALAGALGAACAISFTLDTDGNLPSGETLKSAITTIDANVNPQPHLYCINCVHPIHLKPMMVRALENEENWIMRVKGVRCNGSSKSHEELDNCTTLDAGDAKTWAKDVVELREVLPSLDILGGCCGTSASHCEEIAKLMS